MFCYGTVCPLLKKKDYFLPRLFVVSTDHPQDQTKPVVCFMHLSNDSVLVLARSLKTSGIGRLLVTVTEAQELKACKPNGEALWWDTSVEGHTMYLISNH